MSPADIPDGYERVWVPEDGSGAAGPWKVATPEERRTHKCRFVVGPNHQQCGLPPVAALDRGIRRSGVRHESWWFYCSSHLYGRRIRNGRVEHRIVRKIA